MKKNLSALIFVAIIFFIMKLIISDHQLQGKLFGLVVFALLGVIIVGIIQLFSKIFKRSK